MASKIEQARELYVFLQQPENQEEGRSIRQLFIAQAQVKCGLSKSAAITYYTNLKSEADGKGLYRHHKRNKQAAPEPTVDPNEANA